MYSYVNGLRMFSSLTCNMSFDFGYRTPEPGIYAGPDLANYEFNRRDFLCFDKMHFNAKVGAASLSRI